MTTDNMNNPWNGLRTYQEGETIYGRSEEINILTLLIMQNRQTVIYGKSGIGKSSILHAGVFPLIRSKNILPVCIRLEHNSKISYLDQIKIRIKEEIDRSNGNIYIQKIIDKTETETLWEFFHRLSFYNEKGETITPLIVFDQFEEIFTLENDYNKINNFFRQMADVLNNIMPEYLLTQNKHDDVLMSLQKDDDCLDLGLERLESQSYVYKQDTNFHFVFTLREDFLSYFEVNTTDIPSLKNNRYCLQPISYEQAIEIITSPKPGLVNSDVANLIIEKITGLRDLKIDRFPKVQVDAAILSLYLNQLFEKMIQDGQSELSKQLIETYSDNIIQDFYNSSISQLSEKSIDWLENTLVNEEGRRDNRDKSTVLKETDISENQLSALINDIKILHQFSYGGRLRIEYIHDILCPVVIRNREYRRQSKIIREESKKLIEQQELHTKKLKNRNKLLAYVIGLLLIIGIILSGLYFLQEKTYKYKLLLSEDNTINLTDYWMARVTILSGSDTICVKEIDKSNPLIVFDAQETDPKKLQYIVDFLIGDFGVAQNYKDSINSNNEISIPISHARNRNLIKGIVATKEGSKAPIYDAIVIIDDQLAKTNYKGEFELYVDSDLQDSTVRIMKKGYKPFEGKLQNGVYWLDMNRDNNFLNIATSMQHRVNNAQNVISLDGYFYGFENGDTTKGKAHMKVVLTGDSIAGYTYYNKIHERERNKLNSYFIINGKFNPVNNAFKMHLMDAVYNEIEYVGYIDQDSLWYGEAFDRNKKIGFFRLR